MRQVWIGNGPYPTETRAKQYGLSKAELAKAFYDGLNVDYGKLAGHRRGRVQDSLVRQEAPHHDVCGNRLDCGDREPVVLVSDGVLSDDKFKKGGPACQVWLPAGDVYLVPVPGTAEGTVAVDRMLVDGKEVRGLNLAFRGRQADGAESSVGSGTDPGKVRRGRTWQGRA